MRSSTPRSAFTIAPVAFAALIGSCTTATPVRPVVVYETEDRETVIELEPMLDHGMIAVETFFGRAFPEQFAVTVFPSREALDASFPPQWGISKTQSWMVATGVASDLRILSPRVWSSEASGHDPHDRRHVQGIITHELVHVFHGQHNRTRDFTGCEEIGWFLEGLAVLVSGQLDEGHAERASEAVAKGATPATLATAWSGEYRYGICGSLVRYVDVTYGRDAIVRMLGGTTQEELLSVLGIGESELLQRWAESARLPATRSLGP